MFGRVKNKPGKNTDSEEAAPALEERREPATVMPRSVYQVVLTHRSAVREFTFFLANFKMLGADLSSIELLSGKKSELAKSEEQFRRQLKPEALKAYPALESLNASAMNVLNAFSAFTKGYIEEFQHLDREFNLSVQDKTEYWISVVTPVYREYMMGKLSHINEAYDALAGIDKYIEGLEIDFSH